MKVKVTVTKEDMVLVKVPYKNGYVTWKLYRESPARFEWGIYRKKMNYQPLRVKTMHRQFLNGKLVRSKITNAAAASHKYDVLDQLKNCVITPI